MKFFSLSFLIICSFILKAQNYAIVRYDTVKYGNCGELLLPTITFVSTTGNPVQMHLQRIVKNIPTGWTSCFCAPTCIAETQDSLDFTIPIGENHSEADSINVSPNFGTDSIPGVGEVIVVFNEIGVNDFDTIRFRGISTQPTGVKVVNNKEPFLISPVPSSESILIKNFDEQVNEIQLFDMNGKEIYKNNCLSFQSEFKVSIQDFPSGHYFLLIRYANNSVFRKKIVKSDEF